MKKKLAAFLAALMSVSVLFSFGACTKNKTSSEQFQDAVVSTAQFFSDYLKAGSLLPDFSEKEGMDANVSLQVDQLESGGVSLLEEKFSAAMHIVSDKAAGTAAAEGNLTLGSEKIAVAAYLKSAAELFLGFPDASEKYLSLMQADSASSEWTNVWNAIAQAVKEQISDASVKTESVEYEIDGSTQKGVTKLTFSADETQRKAIFDAVSAALKEAGDDTADDTTDQLSELTITFYVYRGSVAAVEFVLAADGDSAGKITGTLAMQNKDGKQFAAKGKISFESEETSFVLTLDANQTVADSGKNGMFSIGMTSSDLENFDVTLKADYKDEIADQTVTQTGAISVSVKTGAATVSLEIPVNAKYAVDGDKVTGTFDASMEVETLKMAFSGSFDLAAAESGKVTIPTIPAENLISLTDAENNSDAFLAFLGELQAKYPNAFRGFSGPADPIDPDAMYPAFYLSNEETGELLEFYTDNTGVATSYALFEQTDGQAVVTLDGNGSQVGFAYKPFGTDGYTLNQTVQLEDLTFEALVTEEEITLTNEEIGWTFWFMPEETYGMFQRGFTYTKTDSAIQIQVQPGGTFQELQKTDDDTYSLNGVEYEYSDAADYAD
ncbi:MAG: hypothetical protein ACOYJR_09870 [Acutalibacteraceae bacterium]